MGDGSGSFTVQSAYQNMRGRREEKEWSKYMWVKGLPFNIGFFLWRVWRGRIATDDNLKRMKIQVVSKCININELTLSQLIYRWWEHKTTNKLERILRAIPEIIMWELWKRRNAIRHGKKISFNLMYHQCQLTIYHLIMVKFPWIKQLSAQWQEMVKILQNYRPILHHHLVKWELPIEGWITCNMDGASKGNLGQSAYGFFLRDREGDLIYVEAQSIGITTTIEAEVREIWEALLYCRRKGLNQVQLETDSLMAKNMVTRNGGYLGR
ncbi:hypothetical protein R3W88_022584 [Solanum pinnatisectum]|uniref:RNase H type-1 domain-containing protein n=1 Tax=Solanum pinnatisectum TaxID=50273 RepID=A0AAV9LV01_9SOLN|nr:hypothetical protein R3W88_022584 [Solanum pinnatisectum]